MSIKKTSCPWQDSRGSSQVSVAWWLSVHNLQLNPIAQWINRFNSPCGKKKKNTPWISSYILFLCVTELKGVWLYIRWRVIYSASVDLGQTYVPVSYSRSHLFSIFWALKESRNPLQGATQNCSSASGTKDHFLRVCSWT